jgi:Domain of Unknown Function (DUF1080)
MFRMCWLCTLFLACLGGVTNAEEKPEIPLFNGKDFDGWTFTLRPPKDKPDATPDPRATWSVVDGTIVCRGKPNGYLATKQEYGNYTLKLKWRFPKDSKGGNGGVLLHVTGEDRVWPHSVEAQMFAGKAGDLWVNADAKGEFPKLEVDPALKDPANKRHFFRINKDDAIEKPFGEWNDYTIVCKDGAIALTVNGHLCSVAKSGSLTRGRIGLQSEGAEIHFRDLVLRPE